MEVFDLILASVLSMGLTYTFVACDRTRIPSPWRARGWNQATTGAAIFTFSPLCILAYFWTTRRSLSGLLQGLAAIVFLLITQIALTLLYQNLGLVPLLAVLVLQPIVLTLIPPLVVFALI